MPKPDVGVNFSQIPIVDPKFRDRGSQRIPVGHVQTILILLATGWALTAGYAQDKPEGSKQSRVFGVLRTVNDEPVSFAAVRVLKVSDSSLVKGSVADSVGAFEITNLPNGSYVLALNSVSSIPVFSKSFSIDSTSNVIDLGVLNTDEKVMTLSEVQITEKKPLIEVRNGSLIINIENSFLSPGNVIAEILPKLPGVSKTNNRLQLNGKSVLILIDGKGQYNSMGVEETIKNLGANQVQSIEIISNPSAKYDANIQGIINIKLKKARDFSSARANYQNQLYPMDGVSGVGYFRVSPGVTLNRAFGRLTTSTSLDFASRSSFESYNANTNSTDIVASNLTSQKEREKFLSYRSDIQYSFNERTTHLIGVTFSGYYSFSHRGLNNSTINYSSANQNEPDSTLVSGYSGQSIGAMFNNTTIYYSNEVFKGKHQLDIVFDTYKRTFPQSTTYTNALYANNGSVLQKTELINSDRTNRIGGNAINVNYQIPLKKEMRLEIGGKTAYFRNQTGLDYALDGSDITSVGVSSFGFSYNEQFVCSYATFSKDFGVLDVTTGLRVEDVHGKAISSRPDIGESLIHYLKAYPSISFNFVRGKKVDYQFSYSRKIARRPSFNELNAAREYRGPLNVFIGNSKLQGQITNTFNATTTINSSITISGNYDMDQNVRAVVPLVKKGEPFSFQVVNVEKARSFIVNVNAPIKASKQWKFNANVSVFNHRLVAPEYDLKTNAWNYNINLNNDVRLHWFNLQINGSYSSPSRYGFYAAKQMLSTYLSLNKEVFDKAGSVTIFIDDMFGTAKWRSIESFYGIYEKATTPLTSQRMIGIRYNHRFATGVQAKRVNKRGKSFGEVRMN